MNGYQESDLLVGGIGVGLFIFGILALVFGTVVLWKIYDKAGEPGWATLIPFYNLYVLFKIVWGNGLLFLLLLIPLANLVIAIILPFKLSKAFGRGGGFGFGLLVFPYIFYPILAFGSSQYVGVRGPWSQPVQPVVQQQIFIQTPQANSAYPQQPGYAPQVQGTTSDQQPYRPYPPQQYPQGQSAYPQSPYGYPQQPTYYQQIPPSQPVNGVVCPACGTVNPFQTPSCQRCGNRIA